MTGSLLKEAEGYLNLAAGIVVEIDADLIVRFINERGCLILEASKEEIIGKNWFDHFLPGDKRAEMKALFVALFQTPGRPIQKLETTVLTKKGNTRFISWYNTIIKEEKGRIPAILGLGEDITDRTILLQRLSMQEEIKRQQLISAVIDAQEKERSEIAVELHDNVNQLLTTCKLLLEQEVHDGNASPFVSNTSKYLQNAINEIRNLSHRLNPTHLEEMSFVQAIEEMADKINLTSRLHVTVTIKGADFLNSLPPPVSLSVFRILQEQISNIIKHAAASKIEITMHADKNSVDFEVKDNGKGFVLKTITKGLGLKSIYSRAELHSGTVYINTAPGEGCVLSVHIPYNYRPAMAALR